MNYFSKLILCSFMAPAGLLGITAHESLKHATPELLAITFSANKEISLTRNQALESMVERASREIGIDAHDMCPVIFNAHRSQVDGGTGILTPDMPAAYSTKTQKIYIFDMNRSYGHLYYRLLHECAHRWQDVQNHTKFCMALQQPELLGAIEHEAEMRALERLNCPACTQDVIDFFQALQAITNKKHTIDGYATIDDIRSAHARCTHNTLCPYHRNINEIVQKTQKQILELLKGSGFSSIDIGRDPITDQIALLALTFGNKQYKLTLVPQ